MSDDVTARARKALERVSYEKSAALFEVDVVRDLLTALETAESAMGYLAGHDRAGLDHLDEAMQACTERDDAEAKLREAEAKLAAVRAANNLAAFHRFDLDPIYVGDQEHLARLAAHGEKPKGGPDNFYNGVSFVTRRIRAILDSKGAES
jgi:hypothetical protein